MWHRLMMLAAGLSTSFYNALKLLIEPDICFMYPISNYWQAPYQSFTTLVSTIK